MSAGFDVKLTITGIQQAQEANLQAIAALKPDGELGQAVQDVTVKLHRYAVSITHVGRYTRTRSGKYRWARPGESARGGGALRASHRMDVQGLRGRIYIDPASVNPLTRRKPSVYGVYENERGGAHAFYGRTLAEMGPQVAQEALGRVALGVQR